MHAGSVLCAICFVWFCRIALFSVKDVGMNISWNFFNGESHHACAG